MRDFNPMVYAIKEIVDAKNKQILELESLLKELIEKWHKDNNRWVNTYCAEELEKVLLKFHSQFLQKGEAK